MSPFLVTPSNRQPNEGESLTTSLSGFTPGSTLYFKVSGRGINKKDFAAGALKGKVTVDANGVASIAHTLRADKTTEGSESFSIQVFSDKKMRNRLGESAAVGIGDTSVKAGKASGGDMTGGGGKENTDLYYTDLITGETVKTDTIYANDSLGFAKLVELSRNRIIVTIERTSTTPSTDIKYQVVNRFILTGDYSYNNGRIDGATRQLTGFEYTNNSLNERQAQEAAVSYEYSPGSDITSCIVTGGPCTQASLVNPVNRVVYVFIDPPGDRMATRDVFIEYAAAGLSTSTLLLNDRSQLGNLPDANFAPNEWWLDPFAANFI